MIDKKHIKVNFYIGDNVIDQRNINDYSHKKIKDITYSYRYDQIYYKLLTDIETDREEEIREYHKKVVDRYHEHKRKCCDSCKKRGLLNKYDFICDNDDCDVHKYEGLTYSFSTNKIGIPSCDNKFEIKDKIMYKKTEHKIDDIMYSTKDDKWYYNLSPNSGIDYYSSIKNINRKATKK